MSTSVFCMAKTRVQAESIVEDLCDKGHRLHDISVLYPNSGGWQDMGHVITSKAPEGVATGAASGGVAGGVLGLLAGLGALTIPGVGPFIAAGPIMAALSGAAIGGATGGIVGGFVGLGIPEVEARRYESKLKTGNYIIAVHTEDQNDSDRVESLMRAHLAEDIVESIDTPVPKS